MLGRNQPRARRDGCDDSMISTPTAASIPFIESLPQRAPVAVRPSTSIADAARVMRARHVSALVVGTPSNLISIVTERDLTQALADGCDPRTGVLTISTPDPLTVTPETEVLEASVLMLTTGVRHLVVSRAGRVTGVVSIQDALASLAGTVNLQGPATAIGPLSR